MKIVWLTVCIAVILILTEFAIPKFILHWENGILYKTVIYSELFLRNVLIRQSILTDSFYRKVILPSKSQLKIMETEPHACFHNDDCRKDELYFDLSCNKQSGNKYSSHILVPFFPGGHVDYFYSDKPISLPVLPLEYKLSKYLRILNSPFIRKIIDAYYQFTQPVSCSYSEYTVCEKNTCTNKKILPLLDPNFRYLSE